MMEIKVNAGGSVLIVIIKTEKKLFNGEGKMTLLLQRERNYFFGVKRKGINQESSSGTLKEGWRAMLKIPKQRKVLRSSED